MPYTAGTISKHCEAMEKIGVSEGGTNKPDTASESPDLHEIKLIVQAKQHVEMEISEKTDSFVDAEKKLRDIDQSIEVVGARCRALIQHDLIGSSFHSALVENEQRLIKACADSLESKAALNAFKKKNGIDEPAQYPADKLYHFSLLMLFVAIETAVNAFFYQGSSGLLGGAIVAFAVSVINIGIAALLGATSRYKNLSDAKSVYIGYGSIIAFIVLAIVLNLIFSTFRIQYELLQAEVLERGLDDATPAMLVLSFKQAVLEAFGIFTLSFPTIDVMSFILFFIGSLCSLFAFWKGYKHDDKFPAHGEMDRINKKNENEFSTQKQNCYDSAVNIVNKELLSVEEAKNSLISSHRTAGALKAQVQGAQLIFEGNVKKIQGELNLVLEAYRGANKAVRTTAAPNYFSETPNIVPDDDTKNLNSLIKSIEEVSEKSKNISDEMVPVLSGKSHEIREKINYLTQEPFQKFINEIIKKATDHLKSNGQVG
jgi:hypothetical protein